MSILGVASLVVGIPYVRDACVGVAVPTIDMGTVASTCKAYY